MDPQDEVIKIVDGTGHGAEDLQVFVCREEEIEIGFFNNSTYPREDHTAISVEVFSKNLDRAGGRPKEREDHPDRCALPCPIWPKKAKDISSVNLDI